MFAIANKELAKISEWLNNNKLYVNYDKTNYMIFKPNMYRQYSSVYECNTIKFDGHLIKRICSTKYLGVIIDENLNWSEHIKTLLDKVSSLTGIMYRIKQWLPIHCTRQIYFALIHSKLVYGI